MDEGPADQVSPRVVANMIELERLWRKHKLSADAAYQVLRDVVMPAARPDEVFLYATPLNVSTLRRPQSVGKLLADWAVKAGKADELKQAMTARKGQATAALPLAILTAQLALASNDPAATARGDQGDRGASRRRIRRRNTAELACHVAIPALGPPAGRAGDRRDRHTRLRRQGDGDDQSARAAGFAATHARSPAISTGRRRRRSQTTRRLPGRDG